MYKYLVASIVAITVLAFMSIGHISRAFAYDPFKSADKCQTNADGNTSVVCTVDGNTDPITGKTGVINNIANIFAFITGLAAIVVIIVGGFEYVRSSGEPAKTAKAKDTILFALIGLIVVAVARSAVALFINKL